MPVQFRPELHVTAETGVLNAPAGALKDGDTWHIFCQFQPHVDAAPRWGHQVSVDDPFSWAECNDVLAPVGGETGVRAGTVLPREHGVDLYFTSVTAVGTSIQIARIDSIADCTDVSDDGSALDEHVQRLGATISDHGGFQNFRSPCVVRGWEAEDDRDAGHEGWLMLAVTGTVEDPQPVILSSPDAIDWTVVGALAFEGDHGLVSTRHLVAPRILRLRDEVDGQIYDVVLITIEREGEDVSGYLVGTLEGATFRVVTGFTRLDYGYDFTRPRNTMFTPATVDPDKLYDEAVIFGLLNRAGRQDRPTEHLSLQESDWANVLSLPRVVTLQGGKLFQTPYAGMLEAIATSQRARSWIGLASIPEGGRVTVDVLDVEGEVAARIIHESDRVSVDRSMNEFHAGDAAVSAPVHHDDTNAMSIIADGSTLEVFADGGEAALASRVYIRGGHPSFVVSADGGARLEQAYEHSSLSTIESVLDYINEMTQSDGSFPVSGA